MTFKMRMEDYFHISQGQWVEGIGSYLFLFSARLAWTKSTIPNFWYDIASGGRHLKTST